MSKVLIVTVGGSYKPIVTAIETLQPERVVFICSDGDRGSKPQVIGKGNPCEFRRGTEVIERLPNIPTQANLGERFQEDRDLVEIQEPDDLSECYIKASSTIQTIKRESPEAEIIADYTGGTKSMSVGLAMASLDYKVQLYLTTANRTNIIKVERGEMTGQASVSPLIAERTIEQFLPLFLHQHNYSAAVAELKQLSASMQLPADSKKKIQSLYYCCSGFETWDKFQHQEALDLLQSEKKRPEIKDFFISLKRVINSRSRIDDNFKITKEEEIPSHGYEIVQDLLLNAERRATQERYDDAVGRLYRALELLAQIRLLQEYEIKTGSVELEKLPESLRTEYQQQRSPSKKEIKLGLLNSYELLSKLPNEPLGELYQKNSKQLQNALSKRNNSLFAHGFQPINNSDYQVMKNIVVKFIEDGINLVIPENQKWNPLQFPTRFSI
ncbi:MAG: TIGR02710 family CRISPR-associated CARF protein [Mastigocoleus sp.]